MSVSTAWTNLLWSQFLVLKLTNATKDGNHTVCASNTSAFLENGTVLYNGESCPTEINFNAVFRFLTYVIQVQSTSNELEVCEIGIVGECFYHNII